jgi:hypothetical protein
MIVWPIEIEYNKYAKWYEQLILKAKARGTVVGYKEKHHVVPNCFVKNNSPENLVELTAREHYIAHLLLWKIPMEPKWHNKMSMALHVMVNGSGHGKQDRSYLVSSRIYESSRAAYITAMKAYFAEHGGTWLGRKHSPESLEKMRAWQQDPVIKQQQRDRVTGKNNPMYGKKHSDERRKQISNSTKESWSDPALREKQSKITKERWEDPEYKQRMIDIRKTSEGWLNRDWKDIAAKAAAGRKANGTDKRTEEQKKQLSETRLAKFASGELVAWNKGKKLGPSTKSKEVARAGALKAANTRKINGTQIKLIGENNPFYGKKHSEETKAKIAATKAAKKAAGWVKKPSTMSEETLKAAIAKANATKAAKKAAGIKRKPSTMSEETRLATIEKIKATKAANGNPLKGKPRSPESVAKGLATRAAKKDA